LIHQTECLSRDGNGRSKWSLSYFHPEELHGEHVLISISYITGIKQQAPSQMLVSELGSLSLEFTHLSQISGDPKYYDAIQRISDVFEQHQNKTKLPGMWPVVVNAAAPSFLGDNNFHFGGMSDSLYEYLPKQYMMLGGLVDQSRKMYEIVIEIAKKYLFFRPLTPGNEDILISGELRAVADGQVNLISKGQHLGCFVGGMVGIGSKIFSRPDDLEIAKKLTNGCVWAYASQVTGIAPEIFTVINCLPDDDCEWSDEKWHKAVQEVNIFEKTPGKTMEEMVRLTIQDHHLAPGFTHLQDKRYILRPEAIESVFIMYRITGDAEWLDKAWTMFERIEQVTKTEIASSAISDVTSEDPPKMDSMESFWLAETLKYFYLIFSDMELVSLDEYVLNTEAHPLRRPKR
jgi:mannosyl-oligosaccharide alpha-1,2-mannosidase